MKKVLMLVAAAAMLFAGCKKEDPKAPEVNGEEFIAGLIGLTEAEAEKKIKETYPDAVKLNDISEGLIVAKAWGWGEQFDTKDAEGKAIKVCAKTIAFGATDGVVDDPQFFLFSKSAMNMADLVPVFGRGDAAIAKTKFTVNEGIDTYEYYVGAEKKEFSKLDDFTKALSAAQGVTAFEYSSFITTKEEDSEICVGYYYKSDEYEGLYSFQVDDWVIY